jgi:hypothetical protein
MIWDDTIKVKGKKDLGDYRPITSSDPQEEREFRPKPNKDMYKIQNLTARSFGLPSAKDISASCDKTEKAQTKKKPTKMRSKKKSPSIDSVTSKLWEDLVGGAVSFTRSSIEGGTVPTLGSIDSGRDLVQKALKRISLVGDNIDKQIADKRLRDISTDLYSLIPKIKPRNVDDKVWLLSNYTDSSMRQSTIDVWKQDLDAFETAAKSGEIAESEERGNPMEGVPADMEWIDPKSDLGKWLYKWWPAASRNRHRGVGPMKVVNAWKVARHGDDELFLKEQMKVYKSMAKKKWNNERPLHQERKRPDLDGDKQELYWGTNTALCFHGTRTVNVPGIVRENLRLPHTLVGVVVTGAMFGGGLYWADDWRKSDGYTSNRNSYWSGGSGGVRGRHAFMFAADTLMGIPHVASGPKGYTKAPSGCHSVFGKAGHSHVQNNEWIVYQRNRNVLRYLVEYQTR